MDKKVQCTYCANQFPEKETYKLHEKDKPNVRHYCERCYQVVKIDMLKLPWKDKDLYHWTW